MEESRIIDKYKDITTSEYVVIDTDYPYYDVPDLPYCKTLYIHNSKIGKIGNLPLCESANINTCTHFEDKNNSGSFILNLGNLEFIGDLPKCKSLHIHTYALKRIGNLESCENLSVTNESEEYFLIKNKSLLSVLIEDCYNSVIYSGHHNMSVKDTILKMIEEQFPLSYIDFKTTIQGLNPAASFIDLTGIKFPKMRLFKIRFYGCDLSNTDFTDCSLEDVVFENSILDYSNLSGLDLARTEFRNCTLYQANLKNCKIPIELLFLLYDIQKKINTTCPEYHHSQDSKAAIDERCNSLTNEDVSVLNLNVQTVLPYTVHKENVYSLILKTITKSDIEKNSIIVTNFGKPIENFLNDNFQIAFYFTHRYQKRPAFLYTCNENIIQLDYGKSSFGEILQQKTGNKKILTNLFIRKNNDKLINLAGYDFSGYEFKNIIFESCDLSKCNFQNAVFYNVTFTNCICDETIFTDSIFFSSIFKKCNLKTANFDKAEIDTFLTGQLREQNNLSQCYVRGYLFPDLCYNCPAKLSSSFPEDTVWDNRNLYIVCERENDIPVFVGSEKDCYYNHQVQNSDFSSYYVLPFESYLVKIAEKYPQKDITERCISVFSISNSPETYDKIDTCISNVITIFHEQIFFRAECHKLCCLTRDLRENISYCFPNSFSTIQLLNINTYLFNSPTTNTQVLQSPKIKK